MNAVSMCRWIALVLLLDLTACARPVFSRNARIDALEAQERELRADGERLERLIETLRATSDELLARLDESRASEAALRTELERVQGELASESERRLELEEAHATALADLARSRDTTGDSKAKVSTLEAELEAAKTREKQLERRLETLRVCCQAPEP